MVLLALLEGFIIWGVTGVVLLFALPLEWYDSIFDSDDAPRWLVLLLFGPIIWIVFSLVALRDWITRR